MKKFASLVLSVVILATMLCVFAVPASAETFNRNGEDSEYTITSGSYKDLIFGTGVTLTVNGSVTINEGSRLKLNVNSKLIIDENSYLKGNGIIYFLCFDTSSIEVKDGGAFDIEFKYSEDIDSFTTFLEKNGIGYYIDGNSVKSLCRVHSFEKGKCSVCGHVCQHNNGFDTDYKCNICKWECEHEKWNNGKCELCQYECTHEGDKCDTCGKEIVSNLSAGSTLSEGSLTIIVGVAAAVIFGLGGFILGTKKKKKPAVAGGAENKGEE